MPDARWSPAALAVAPLALLATGAWMRAALGPEWLAGNFDPGYAYLMNGVLVSRGLPPFLIQHPGIPLITLSTLVIGFTHAVSGQGTLAQDVVARPETFIGAIHWAALAVSAVLLTVAGIVVRRRAGLGAALLVQAAPWLAVITVELTGHVRVEPLIIGAAAMWTAVLVGHTAQPARATAVWLGIWTGVTICLHLAALPLVVAPLLLLERGRDRVRFVAVAAAAFLIAFLPAIVKLPSFVKYFVLMSLSSGRYGSGAETVIKPESVGPALRMLIGVEPIASALAVASVAAAAAWCLRTPATEAERLARRGLIALTGTIATAYLLTAKHPDGHYLVPMICTLGASVWLIGRYLRALSGLPLRPLTVVVLALIVVVQGRRIHARAGLVREARAAQELAAQRTAELADHGRCFVVSAYPVSQREQALQWGSLWAEYNGRVVFGPEITERFPHAAFDLGFLEIADAYWNPLDVEAILRREPCVVYTRPTVGTPASTNRIRLELVSSSGTESLYRLRLAQ